MFAFASSGARASLIKISLFSLSLALSAADDVAASAGKLSNCPVIVWRFEGGKRATEHSVNTPSTQNARRYRALSLYGCNNCGMFSIDARSALRQIFNTQFNLLISIKHFHTAEKFGQIPLHDIIINTYLFRRKILPTNIA
jgi:hypothetical protein